MMRGPTGIVKRIIDLMNAHPEGLASGDIREKLGIPASEQTHLDRRRRDVRKFYELITTVVDGIPRYTLGPKRENPLGPDAISGRVRAEVLHAARGRCQMCGRSVEKYDLELQVDHKIPQDWGGTNDRENLWALCKQCNHGKKNLFSSQDDKVKQVLGYESVHVRIGELLKLNFGEPVPSYLIDFVASRDDWPKRTRELRYLGWNIEVSKKKQPSGRVKSFYTLKKFNEWPENPSLWIQEYERQRAIKNRGSSGDEDADNDLM